MIPDVADVFELLEFNRVIKVFETTEEALAHFEKTVEVVEGGREPKWSFLDPRVEEGESLTTQEEPGAKERDFPLPEADRQRRAGWMQGGKTPYPKKLLSLTEGEEAGDKVVAEEPRPVQPVKEPEKFPAASFYDSIGISSTVMDRDLPLPEKIKLLVIDNPLPGAWKIKHALNSSRFGYVRAGVLEVRRILKELELDTKEKRYRFWRSR
jgi:hypothetical protein